MRVGGGPAPCSWGCAQCTQTAAPAPRPAGSGVATSVCARECVCALACVGGHECVWGSMNVCGGA
eukprot:364608-Chlamydomonas_euryale.AAC.2